ncbi:hypothetical protein Fuma_05346 [Fuerstiella marisgermanici]|uniref:Uncharacterized protein n=1 Tax=Fuerstiella marisgermanici TaxID=1891926 RepID=A0A1P8WNQ6_9PLAN|nr:hypothetical protein Fuma_05346 [Fuerstiella marisgermanici]
MPRLFWLLFIVGGLTVQLQAQSSSVRANADDSLDAPTQAVAGEPLRQALAQRRALYASGQTLRAAVTELQSATGVAVVLDRRIDPGTVIEVSTGFVSVRETIVAISESVPKAAASIGDRYVFVGPPVAARRLRTLTEIKREAVEQVRRSMDAAKYRTLVATRAASWSDLAQPRQLIIDAASDAGLQVDNPDVVPHDLWAAAQLPDLNFADFATLVLNQFDFTFELNSDGIVTIVPVPDQVVVEKQHRVRSREKQDVAKRWRAAFPDLDVSWKGAMATVTARVETHERLEQLIRGDAPVMVQAAGIRDRSFTMTVPDGTPVGTVINSLQGQGIAIRIEGRSGEKLASVLQQTMQLKVDRMPAAEFFKLAFGGLGATVDIRQDEVVLRFSEDGQ